MKDNDLIIITEARLQKIWALEQQLKGCQKALKDELAELQEDFEEGALIQTGRFSLTRKVNKGSKRPKWKDEFKKFVSADLWHGLEEGIISKTAPGADSIKMIIKEMNPK